MLLYFVRHGQTDSNVNGIIQGHLDHLLNDAGRAESECVAQRLNDVPFMAAYSSDLGRAMETAEIIAAKHRGLVPHGSAKLRERTLGSLDGQKWVPGSRIPDDAEPAAVFRGRVQSFIAEFLHANMSAPTDEAILVVSHGGYMAALLGVLLSPPYSFKAPGVDSHKPCMNTSIMLVKAKYMDKGGRWSGRILSWADVEHLGDNAKDWGVADDLKKGYVAVEK